VTSRSVTIGQFLGRATVKYRNRYLRLLKPEDPWADRPEYLIPHADHAFGCGPYLVSRPYGQGLEYMRDLVDWAEKHGLDLNIDAPSSWHPATLLVEAYRPEWREEFWQQAEAHGDAFKASLQFKVYHKMHAEMRRVYAWGDRESGIYILNTTTGGKGTSSSDPPLPTSRALSAKSSYRIQKEYD
jgi:hypothetical protein